MLKKVYMPGVFDLLHVGHVAALARASLLGNMLIVGVPSDEVVREDKGRLPIIPLEDRIQMLLALRIVNWAWPYETLDFIPHLERYDPDVLAVSETWGTAERHLAAEKWIAERGKQFVKLPYYRGESSTSIKQRIIEQGAK